MRDGSNGRDVVLMLLGGTKVAFESVKDEDRDELLYMAGLAQDRFYRHVMEITILDQHTIFYSKVAMYHFFEQLSELGIRTFFILDNTLREDRFAAVLELFGHAGITTVTPARDGAQWPELAGRIYRALEAGGHAAYIEPDAVVNHIEAAKELARAIPCVATFRNLEPGDPRLAFINMKWR